MTGRSRKGKRNAKVGVKNFLYWASLALTVIVVSFLTGFLIGLGAHRDGKQIAEFVSGNIRSELSNGSAMVVFQCGSNQKLVAYDLLSDEVLVNRNGIEARLHNPVLKFTQNELFGAAAGFAASSLGVAFSFGDEVRLAAAGGSSLRRVAFVLVLAVPSIYLGYGMSDYLKLECGSDELYEYLYKAGNWRPHQLNALRALYESVEPCVPRRVSFNGYSPNAENKGLDFWLQLVSGEMEGLKFIGGPTEEEKAALLAKLSASTRVRFGKSRVDFARAVWGDSIFLRLFGVGEFTEVDPKIDAADFRALLQQARAWRRRAEDLKSRSGKNTSLEQTITLQYQRARHEGGYDGAREHVSSRGLVFGPRLLMTAESTATIN
jgi:hypothetical protein